MFEKYIFPLKSLKELFVLFFLYFLPDTRLSDIEIIDIMNAYLGTKYSNNTLRIIFSSLSQFFGVNTEELYVFATDLKNLLKNKSEIVNPPVNNCFECMGQLTPIKASKTTLAFCISGIKEIICNSASCKKCNMFYFIDYFTKNSEKLLYEKNIFYKYLKTSEQTVFEISLLEFYNHNLIRSAVGFEAFSDIYNNYHKLFNKYFRIKGRQLYRMRLSEGWFTYTLRNTLLNFGCNKYFDSKYTEDIIGKFLAQIKFMTIKKWSSNHDSKCQKENCKYTGKLIFRILKLFMLSIINYRKI